MHLYFPYVLMHRFAFAVQVVLDGDQGLQRQQMLALATQYFNNSFILVNGSWVREDPEDRGPEFRNVVGLPGGVHSPLYPFLARRNIYHLPIVEGGKTAANGQLHDVQSEGVVYIYDTNTHPFFRAAQHQQFHPNAALRRPVPPEYRNGGRAAMAARNAINTTCGESSGLESSNLETFSCPSLPWVSVLIPVSLHASSRILPDRGKRLCGSSTSPTLRLPVVDFVQAPHLAPSSASASSTSAAIVTASTPVATIQGRTSVPASTTIASGDNVPAGSRSNDGASGGTVGAVVGGVLAIALIAAAGVLWQYRRKKSAAASKYVVVKVKNPMYDHSLGRTAHAPQYDRDVDDADFSDDARSEPPVR